jgi:hypothetical protein
LMTTFRKRKRASPTDRSSDNSDHENTPPSFKRCGGKIARRQLSTSDVQTAVLDKIDEDSRHRAAFEERIENILVGSAAKADPDRHEFMSFVRELAHSLPESY